MAARYPNPDGDDMGYVAFMSGVDALLMGRATFETVLGFGGEWPYDKPVFVLTRTMDTIPANLQTKVAVVKGSLTEVLGLIHDKGYHSLYIDGGATVQSFLKEDLIDELIVSKIPVLLGGGSPLFGDLEKSLDFEFVDSKVLLSAIVLSHYRRRGGALRVT